MNTITCEHSAKPGSLARCGRPATHVYVMTPAPGAGLHEDTIAAHCRESGRCAEHAVLYDVHRVTRATLRAL